jgi:ABC-type nickel/cobalt efflux system permease component RcnA
MGDLSFQPGAGGLPTLRLVFDFTAALPNASGAIHYQDKTYEGRPGWREIIATAGSGAQLDQSSVPTTDRSQALTVYPQDMLTSPPQVSEATFRFAPGLGGSAPSTAPAPAPATSGLTGWIAQRTDAMTELMARKELPLEALLFGILVAFFLGAAHAMSPGHGKTIAAAYLVGSRGSAKHAAFLGLTVTISHTFGVFLLLILVLVAREYFFPEQIYPWLGFLSGMMIVIIGLALAVQRSRPLLAAWRGRATRLAHDRAHALGVPHPHAHAPAEGMALAVAGGASGAIAAPALHPVGPAGHIHDHEHEHEHDHSHDHDHNRDHEHSHDHDHGHNHDHDHSHNHEGDVHAHADGTHSHGPFGKPHSHLPPDGQAISMRSLLALGISGGIIPCPSALVVALAAIRVGRVGEGLLLLLAFSAGLAVVLTVICLLMVYARRNMDRLPFRSQVLAPLGVVSALLVAGLGLVLAISSLAGNTLTF